MFVQIMTPRGNMGTKIWGDFFLHRKLKRKIFKNLPLETERQENLLPDWKHRQVW